MPRDVRALVREATARLVGAGVPSPRVDATALLGHVLQLDPSDVARVVLLGRTASLSEERAYAALVTQRAARVPLQHLTGRAGFRHLDLLVGPGVFVPRPETETLVGMALDDLRAVSGAGRAPIAVDLCTGSGAIALAMKDECPEAQVAAVERSDQAFRWASRNRDALDLDVRLIHADATLDPRSMGLGDLAGLCDVVTSNPPYIPIGAVPRDPEVRDHDPEEALYGGSEDGLAIPVAVARTAAMLLRPGGLLVMEHADSQGESLPSALRATGLFAEVVDRLDPAGRPRHTVARRRDAADD